jgi:hypothetical protein
MLVDLSLLFHLKYCMSSFVTFGSWRINLVERSHPSFTFVVSFVCAGKDLPPSDDTDEGYQWEIQTDEGWVPYWDSQT